MENTYGQSLRLLAILAIIQELCTEIIHPKNDILNGDSRFIQ